MGWALLRPLSTQKRSSDQPDGVSLVWPFAAAWGPIGVGLRKSSSFRGTIFLNPGPAPYALIPACSTLPPHRSHSPTPIPPIGPCPPQLGRVLALVRQFIAYGKNLADTLGQHTAEPHLLPWFAHLPTVPARPRRRAEYHSLRRLVLVSRTGDTPQFERHQRTSAQRSTPSTQPRPSLCKSTCITRMSVPAGGSC